MDINSVCRIFGALSNSAFKGKLNKNFCYIILKFQNHQSNSVKSKKWPEIFLIMLTVNSVKRMHYISLNTYIFHRPNICSDTVEHEPSHKYTPDDTLICVKTSSNTKTNNIIELEYKI